MIFGRLNARGAKASAVCRGEQRDRGMVSAPDELDVWQRLASYSCSTTDPDEGTFRRLVNCLSSGGTGKPAVAFESRTE